MRVGPGMCQIWRNWPRALLQGPLSGATLTHKVLRARMFALLALILAPLCAARTALAA